jgi:hypothetical protein
MDPPSCVAFPSFCVFVSASALRVCAGPIRALHGLSNGSLKLRYCHVYRRRDDSRFFAVCRGSTGFDCSCQASRPQEFPALNRSARRTDKSRLRSSPEGASGMSGPDVPDLKAGAVFTLPLGQNSHPSTVAWRLMADEGRSLVIPAIRREPAFAPRPRNGR